MKDRAKELVRAEGSSSKQHEGIVIDGRGTVQISDFQANEQEYEEASSFISHMDSVFREQTGSPTFESSEDRKEFLKFTIKAIRSGDIKHPEFRDF